MWFCFRICVVKTSEKFQYSVNIAIAFKTAVIIVTAVFYDNPVIIEYNNEARNIKDIFWNKTNKKSAQLTK